MGKILRCFGLRFGLLQLYFEKASKMLCSSWNELLETIRETPMKETAKSVKEYKQAGEYFLPDVNIANYIKQNAATANPYDCGIPSLFDQVWRCQYAMSSQEDSAMLNARHDLVKVLALKQPQTRMKRYYYWHLHEKVRNLLKDNAPEYYHFDDENYCHASFWVILWEYNGETIPIGFLCPDPNIILVPANVL